MPRLTDEERQRILALAQDLPTLWHADTTTAAERKHLLRLLIKDVTLTRQAATVRIGIRWQTQATTTFDIPRPLKAFDACRTDAAVVAQVRRLALTRPDAEIADRLNEQGLRPGKGGGFTPGKVQWIRYAYRIPAGCPQAPGACPGEFRGDGRCSARSAARRLNVDVSTIADWCEAGQLDCVQTAPHGPRWIKLTPEVIAALGKPGQRHWRRNSAVSGQPAVSGDHPSPSLSRL